MIGKIMRGADPAGLIRYLFGRGRHNEHTNPHVVAHWTGLPTQAAGAAGGAPAPTDVRGLIADLKADLAAGGLVGAPRTVWHCALSLPAADGSLPDARWRAVAEQVAAEVGLDDPGKGTVRWVAVHHGRSAAGNDHIHLVATLAGRSAHGGVRDRRYLNRDYAAVRRVCTRLERQWRLTATGAGTGAAHRRPQRAEREVARRSGLRAAHRVRLERAVRSAAVCSRGPAEFTARLAAEGVQVRFSRPSARRAGTWLGVAFDTADYTARDGQPVAFSGRALAADLTAPALQARWDTTAAPAVGGTAQLVAALTDQLRAAAVGTDLPVLRGQAAAAADVLWAAAETCEADREGPWHQAAGEAARAAREPGDIDTAGTTLMRALAAGLGAQPRASSKADAELARAHAMFVRLLRMWARTDTGEPARVAAAAAAAITQITPTPPARPSTAGPRPRNASHDRDHLRSAP